MSVNANIAGGGFSTKNMSGYLIPQNNTLVLSFANCIIFFGESIRILGIPLTLIVILIVII